MSGVILMELTLSLMKVVDNVEFNSITFEVEEEEQEREVMQKLNWYQEELDKYYGDDNNGYIFGIDTGEDIIWYKTEEERDKEYNYEKVQS